MSETAIATQQTTVALAIEQALVGGDLSRLPVDQRIEYYNAVCTSLGLNPLTKPFAYISLNGKLVLYALKDCTEQLRNLNRISLTIPNREVIEGVYVVTAHATRPDGRMDESTGAVSIEGLKGENKANALMKAETKAKRRVTLSICGLGMLDETEIETIPSARFDDGRKAAEAVAEQKIHQLTAAMECPSDPLPSVEAMESRAAKPAKATAAKPKASPPKVSFEMLGHFKEIKGLMGDELYYGVLAQYGYKKSSDIPDLESARAVYKSMNAAHKSLKTAVANRAECQEIFERIGAEKFWAFAGADGLDVEAYGALAGDALQEFTNKLREEFPV